MPKKFLSIALFSFLRNFIALEEDPAPAADPDSAADPAPAKDPVKERDEILMSVLTPEERKDPQFMQVLKNEGISGLLKRKNEIEAKHKRKVEELGEEKAKTEERFAKIEADNELLKKSNFETARDNLLLRSGLEEKYHKYCKADTLEEIETKIAEVKEDFKDDILKAKETAVSSKKEVKANTEGFSGKGKVVLGW